VIGWWIYLNFVAPKPGFDAFLSGFGDGFEP
jgi:hypothetical protein